MSNQIIDLLNIPKALTIRPKVVDLRFAYAKYEGYLKAQADMYRMITAGTWPLKSLTTDELIEIFVSKSVWHANYSKLFPKVKDHSDLVRWLLNDEGAPSNVDVFGVAKQVYTFKDLQAFLDTTSSRVEKRKARGSVGESSRKKEKKASGSRNRTL